MVLTKSNIGPYKSLYGPYLALVQVPGNQMSERIDYGLRLGIMVNFDA